MSKIGLFSLFLGVLLVVIGLILRYLENVYSSYFLGFGLVLESYAFMRYAWKNINRK